MAFILGSLDNAVLGSAFIAASKTSVRGDLRSSSPASAVISVLWIFESLFGCHHQQLSRVFIIGRRTYRSASSVDGNLSIPGN
jgi:hypothetical protein